MNRMDKLLQSALRMKLSDQFDYIENGEKKYIPISSFGQTIDSMSDDEFVIFLNAAYSPESIDYRNRGLM
ncbi:hypothetical protein Q5O24_09095 [Eubacteriaceae bacterium ES3]|nr:hypothetical protein Q5O24_09095 [Eubacteriaceae bacterium ES3]